MCAESSAAEAESVVSSIENCEFVPDPSLYRTYDHTILFVPLRLGFSLVI